MIVVVIFCSYFTCYKDNNKYIIDNRLLLKNNKLSASYD